MQKKTLTIIYWVFTLLFVLFMFYSATVELMQTESAKKVLVDLGYPIYLNYILGIAKIIGGIALLQWKFKTIKEWAYAGFTIDILGASGSAFFVGMGVGTAAFILVFLLPMLVSYYAWKKLYE